MMADETIRKRGEPGPKYDPVNLMHQIFEEADAFIGPAQDVLLSWLIKLPQEMNPATAAGMVLDTTVVGYAGTPSDEAEKLIELLRQVRDHGGISTTPDGNKRRGGRSGRVSGTALQ